MMEEQKINAIGRALLEIVNGKKLATTYVGRCQGMVYMGWAYFPGRGVYGLLQLTLSFPCGQGRVRCCSSLGCN